ncbi:MAG: O-antigen ligase family protein [Gemmatimonadaceae bacterium]
MTGYRRPAWDAVEVVMLAGAAVAPFDLFLELPGIGHYLRALHVWVALAVALLATTDRDRLIAAMDWPLLAFWTMFAFVLLSTLLATPAEFKMSGLASVRVLFLNLLGYTVVRAYYATRPEAWRRFFLTLGTSSVIVAILLTAQAIAVGKTGHAIGDDSFALGLGTVAGSYAATFAAAAAGAIIFATSGRQLAAGLAAFVAHGNAMVFALARGPWLAFGIALLTVIPVAAWRFGGRFSVARTVARGVAIFISLPLFFRAAIVVSPFISQMLVQRVVDVVNVESGTAFSRIVMWQAFLRDVGRSPVFGRGAATYQDISERLGPPGTVTENFAIEMLHAGGIVALTFFALGVIGVALHCLLKPGASARPTITAACLTGATAMVLASMTNPTAWETLFWIVLGLAATRPVVATSPSAAPSAAG